MLVVAEHASRRYGGEAALPMQYYEHLRRRGISAWLLTHARVRPEFEGSDIADHVIYVEELHIHSLLWKVGRRLPSRIDYLTTNYLSRLLTQAIQRRQTRRLVKELAINVIHQPMPVSPKEPSLLYDLGAPVVIGPLNGGMHFPPAFKSHDSIFTRALLRGMRWLSNGLNALVPGKLEAALILVANERTRRALPLGHSPRVKTMVENGVDLRLWRPRAPDAAPPPEHTRYVFMGRLVDVKRVDLLLKAFAQACQQQPMSLLVIGDGPLLPELKRQADMLGILAPDGEKVSGVHFAGWMSQVEAADRLQTQDCLVLPSIRECGGAVVLEAMASSLPVIAVRWGGPADYLDDSCGVLIAPDGPAYLTQEMTHALVKLARDPARRRALGARGRAKVEQEFDWEKKIDAILPIYAQAEADGMMAEEEPHPQHL
ncbi:glycosyltransferase family 4 protein [Hydrogenophaga laconesensis]|uniref:glycosyltransferase family 4 protein n=1 Tax=Hydrogenophaga laconesensis TaxID=1805971 RepID=UPI00286C2483|nr:glycosyltransferase family 4 protein [Hydrogenophaga laconesensis]